MVGSNRLKLGYSLVVHGFVRGNTQQYAGWVPLKYSLPNVEPRIASPNCNAPNIKPQVYNTKHPVPNNHHDIKISKISLILKLKRRIKISNGGNQNKKKKYKNYEQ